jgi:hypothetical protein
LQDSIAIAVVVSKGRIVVGNLMLAKGKMLIERRLKFAIPFPPPGSLEGLEQLERSALVRRSKSQDLLDRQPLWNFDIGQQSWRSRAWGCRRPSGGTLSLATWRR